MEAGGSLRARSYMPGARAYARSDSEADSVRQADIERVRHPELIMKLARQHGGIIAKRDVSNLLHVSNKQACRLLRKLVDEGEIEIVGRGRYAHYMAREKH